ASTTHFVISIKHGGTLLPSPCAAFDTSTSLLSLRFQLDLEVGYTRCSCLLPTACTWHRALSMTKKETVSTTKSGDRWSRRNSPTRATWRTAELETEVAQYKAAADFGDHLVPTHNLLEPGAASNALRAFVEFMVEKAGASLGPANFRAEQRREKAKTRPAGEASAYAITAIAPVELETAVVPVVRLKVKAFAASVFGTIFAPKRRPEDRSLGQISQRQWPI
ncbi:hypothetical protein AC579_3724, partial [Pseudocercospora musae]